MLIHIPHMNSLKSTMQPGALVYIHSKLLVYALEQICLPYCMIVLLPCFCSVQIEVKLVYT